MAASLGEILSDAIRFREVTQKCFKEDDIDSSGYIDRSELHRVMTRVAQCMGAGVPTQEDVNLTMQDTDRNHDGTVSFEEYQEFARKLLTAMYQKMTTRPAPEHPETNPRSKTPVLAQPEKAAPEAKARSKTPVLVQPEVPAKSSVPLQQEVRRPPDSTTEPVQKRVSEPIPQRPSQVPPPQRAGAVQPEAKRTSKSEALSQRMSDFEEYLNYWRLNDAVMQIFTEVESKKIEPTQVYQYAATRLRQMGKDPRFLKH